MGSAAFEEIKRAGRLPSPKAVALELMRLLDEKSTPISQITSTVETDPVLSSRLLKLVNSPLAGVSRTIASLAMAVNLIGRPAVRNLVLGMSLIDPGKKALAGRFDYQEFWSKSLARAVSARHLTRFFKACAPDEAFTTALVSRIGALGFAATHPDDYDQIQSRVNGGPIAKHLLVEREVFGIDQNELSAEMMAEWYLADVFCDAVRHQNVVDLAKVEIDDRSRILISQLNLANSFADIFVKPVVYQEDLAAVVESFESMNLDRELLNDTFDLAKQEWHELGSVFAVKTNKNVPSLADTHSRASRDQRPILVVDDDPTSLKLLVNALTEAGYEVRSAVNGFDAFKAIRAEGYQMVITDWNMPKMDGLQLCGALRNSEVVGFVYVIVLTSSTGNEVLSKAFDAGADDFLIKPWKKIELLARLKAGFRTLNLESNLAAEQRAAHKTNAELASLNDKLKRMATTDELTGLYNRREAMSRLNEYWARAKRRNTPLSCIAFDIDNFKKCNDTYGHDVGDIVLRDTARILKRSVRASESVFRMGGEEFMILCPDSTAAMAEKGAERIRAQVEANRIKHLGATYAVTISGGVAEVVGSMNNCDEVLKVADRALYEAKAAGRNRVMIGQFAPIPVA
ncbi:MAG TPA: diguanylate cyclase [Phycisphaerae bacterium]|nr:diguanylate cyclase [Phycisphaerae bacterium]